MTLGSSVFEISKKTFSEVIDVPTSKSRANRLLLMAALNPKDVSLYQLPESTDVLKMLQIFQHVGLIVERDNDRTIIRGSFPECEINTKSKIIKLQTGDGGTTNRFLIALLSLGSIEYQFFPGGKIRSRPIVELTSALESLGVQIKLSDDPNEAWLSLKGPVKEKLEQVQIDCSKSTQFISALAMALSKTKVKVKPENLMASKLYYEMTLDVIEKSKRGCEFFVDLDFSSLGYPLALATHMGEVRIKNYRQLDHYQPDSQFINILKEAGGQVCEDENGIEVKKSVIRGLEIDCHDFPDLVPTLCYLFSYAKGETRLRNVKILEFKECDRLQEIQKILKLFDVDHSYCPTQDVLTLQGRRPDTHNRVNYNAPDDHRMIMVAALFMRTNNGGKVTNSQHVKKSYPDFFKDLNF